MARNKAYRLAEEKIEEAWRSRARNLDLSAKWDAEDSDKLTELPESLGQLTHLQSLDLSGNQLSALQHSLDQLPQVQSLDLSNNGLSVLPESLSRLTQLQSLNLTNNQLTVLPQALSQLTKLQSLNLTHNQLTMLPEAVGQLTQLQSLDVWENQLRVLPDSLGQLPQLLTLQLDKNRLKALPQSMRRLRTLTMLNLNGNELVELPEWIGELSNLTSLLIGGMNLVDFPISLGALTRLRELYIWGNQLRDVPAWVSNFTKLKILNIHSNDIAQLPEWIGDLRNLEALRAAYNQLGDLPLSLSQLAGLNELDLDNNPLNPELAAAYKEGFDAVKRYLRAKSEAQVVLNEAKLILIGEGEVGKSCLLGALRGDPWEEGRLTTHGIEIKSVKATDPATGTEITLNGWDFGGQRVYRPTHQLFFSSPAVYLVVWKPREGPQQGFVKDWIKLVKHREPEAKILVVATHGGPKERQPDIDRQEIWDLFGKDTVIDFFHIDSKPAKGKKGTCKGIKELRNAIARLAATLPEVGRSVPKRWQDVLKAFEKTGEAYLSLQRVLTICSEHKMSEEEAQDFLRISHRLGHLIHYGHDPRLKDMVILKPDWLATAISFVLDDENTRANHGLVTFRRLGQLWNHRTRAAEFRYPSHLYRCSSL